MTGKGTIFLIVEVADTEVVFSSLGTLSGQPNFTFFLFEDVVFTLDQGGHKRIHHSIVVGLNTGRTGNNQGRLGTIKKD